MKATFENSVSILVKAYLNDTLDRLDCAACAVGNLISGNLNAVPRASRKITFENTPEFVLKNGSIVRVDWDCYEGDTNLPLVNVNDLIGYTDNQIAQIEFAFMGNDTFNGLLCVVDQLAIIHNVDLSVRESAKAMFIK